MTGYRHKYATRLNSFRNSADGKRPLQIIATIPGITAVEINYPEHVTEATAVEIVSEVHELGLPVTALNLRYDPGQFRQGAFTNPHPALREQALEVTREAVELAAALRIPHVILWMGPDGFDYSFQADYAALWELEISGIREIASLRPEVLVSVEYKPSDPRRHSLIRSMGESMMAVHDVALPNFGVTIDFCHSLMAGEIPAAAAALALRDDRLFGVHLNDGYGTADDGMMVGSVHFQQTLELLWTLRQHDFQGTIYFDTFPDRINPAAECAANIGEVERMELILDRIDERALRSAQESQDAIAVTALIRETCEQ